MKTYKSEIISGDIGSVRNKLNKVLESVREVISVTQSYDSISSPRIMVLTIIFTEKVKEDDDYAYKPLNS